MNFSDGRVEETQFQLAPMIDIVFILLIFFIATFVAAEDEKLLSINLPEAQSAKEEARRLEETVVNLTASGEVVVQRRKMTFAGLDSRLRRLMEFAKNKNPGVIIRAHADCPHKYVVSVMDICERRGIRRVFFSTVAMTGTDASHVP